jgi:Flp pilus assembly protein TadG
MGVTERKPRRQRSRGVAALELALSLTFLVPLLMGTLDFGYYFYIATNAQEAARAGVREAVIASAGAACLSAAANAAQTNGQRLVTGPGTGTACNGSAAACYMNEPPLRMGANGGNTTIRLTCLTAPVNPTWTIAVQVDFFPATTFCRWMMPASTLPGPPGRVMYTATLTSD